MEFSLDHISPVRKKVRVALTVEDVNSVYDSVLNDYCKHARLPGFRKGFAPAKLILSKFNNDINQDLPRAVKSAAIEFLMNEKSLQVVGVPEVSLLNEKIERGVAVDVFITVDVHPEFELPEYKNIPVNLKKADVTEADIDNMMITMRSQFAEYDEVKDAAQKGDYVKLSYEGSLNGKALTEGDFVGNKNLFALYGKQNMTWEEAETHRDGIPSVSTLVDALVGKKLGDKGSVEFTLPADLEVPSLAGKTVSYTYEVHEVRRKILPEVNEEFLKKINVPSVEELRSRLEKSIQQRKEGEMANQKQDQLIKHLLSSVDFPVPQSLIGPSARRLGL